VRCISSGHGDAASKQEAERRRGSGRFGSSKQDRGTSERQPRVVSQTRKAQTAGGGRIVAKEHTNWLYFGNLLGSDVASPSAVAASSSAGGVWTRQSRVGKQPERATKGEKEVAEGC
jgi:hypothetical protein